MKRLFIAVFLFLFLAAIPASGVWGKSARELARQWVEKGLALNDNSDAEAQCHQKAVQADPTYSRAWFNLGFVYHCQGKLEQAMEAYRHCLEFNPSRHEAHRNLADCLLRVRRDAALVMPGAFQDFISGILAEGLIRVDNDPAIKVLSQKRQGEDGLSQRTNAVAMPFSDAASMKQRADSKSVKKSVYLAGNADIGLSLGGYAVMSHSGPFFLILLCFRQKPRYIRRLGLSTLFPNYFSIFPSFFRPISETRKLSD